MFRKGFYIIATIFMLLLVINKATAEDVQLPKGKFENAACIQCHEQNNPELINAWRDSVHSQDKNLADCISCHGKQHKNALIYARQDSSCINCHGGKTSSVVHSYSSSKHGLIMKLEQATYDWNQPLKQANYRAPGCAYCHMHAGEHNVSLSVRKWSTLKNISDNELERIQDITRKICMECHAPRYITELFNNGERMLDIARMKVREADKLLNDARQQYSAEELTEATQQLKKMKIKHLKNVYFGIGHQSPDYQWWHGQPALDGDLLRIKGFIGTLQRKIRN